MPDDLIPTIYSYVKPTPEQHRIWRIKKNREAIISNWEEEELDGGNGGYTLIKMYIVRYITEEFADEWCNPDDGVYVITTEDDFENKFNDNPYMYQDIIDEDDIGYKDINYIEKYLHEEGLMTEGEWKTMEDKINLVTYLLANRLWYRVEEAEEQLEPVNVND